MLPFSPFFLFQKQARSTFDNQPLEQIRRDRIFWFCNSALGIFFRKTNPTSCFFGNFGLIFFSLPSGTPQSSRQNLPPDPSKTNPDKTPLFLKTKKNINKATWSTNKQRAFCLHFFPAAAHYKLIHHKKDTTFFDQNVMSANRIRAASARRRYLDELVY